MIPFSVQPLLKVVALVKLTMPFVEMTVREIILKGVARLVRRREGASAVLIKITSVPQMRMIPRVSAHPQMVLSRVSTQAVVKPSMFKRTRLHLRMLIFLV